MRRRGLSVSNRYCCSNMGRSAARLRRRWLKVCVAGQGLISRWRSQGSRVLTVGRKRSRWEQSSSRLRMRTKQNIASSRCPVIEISCAGAHHKPHWICCGEDYFNPQITQMTLIIVVIVAYLLGSIPFGYLIVRKKIGADIRQTGSGGTGATNVSRRIGRAAGVLTLL